MLVAMTTQTEYVDHDTLEAEMAQMRQFLEGGESAAPPAPTRETPPPAPTDDEPKDGAEADGDEEDDDLVDDEEEPEDLPDDEEDEGEAQETDAEAEQARLDAETERIAAEAREARQLEFNQRETELMQRQAEFNRQQREQEARQRTASLDAAQKELVDELMGPQYGMDEVTANRVAGAIRNAVDETNKIRDEAAAQQEHFQLAVRASYVLGQQYGVDPNVLFPPDAKGTITFAQMKAKAEELGKVTALERENAHLKQARVPKQQFQRPGSGTARRTDDQLADRGLAKPEYERTPAEKAAIKRLATGHD